MLGARSPSSVAAPVIIGPALTGKSVAYARNSAKRTERLRTNSTHPSELDLRRNLSTSGRPLAIRLARRCGNRTTAVSSEFEAPSVCSGVDDMLLQCAMFVRPATGLGHFQTS